MQSMRKMTPGTLGGESAVATPCWQCGQNLPPVIGRQHVPKLFVFSQNAIWGHPLHKPPASYVTGPFIPVDGGNGNVNAGATRVYSITGTRLYDGRGLLLWMRGSDNNRADATGGVLEGAYTSSVYGFLQSSSIPTNDIVVVDPTNRYKGAVRVWTHPNGDVFHTLLYHKYVQLWKANDNSDPLAGWTLYSTIQYLPTLALNTGYWEFNQYPVAGKPYFVSDSRWVYVGGRWATASGQFICQAGYWYSDDAGITWTFVMENSNGTYTNYLPGQIARSPTNGYLYSQDSFSSVNQNGNIWESQDDGVTWNSVHTYGGSNDETPSWCLYENPADTSYNCLFALNVEPSPTFNRNVYLGYDSYLVSDLTKYQAEAHPVVYFGSSPTIVNTAKVELFYPREG